MIAPGSAPPRGHFKILLVEDEQDDRDLISLCLEHSRVPAVITAVSTLHELEAALASRSWDVVISDHRLVNFTSREALALVQRVKPAPPFILVSGHIGETAVVEALHDGAVDFVQKDRLTRLGPAVQRAVRNSQLREAAIATELALRDSEARFRTLTELAPVGIYLTNARQECIYVNEQWCTITALAPEVAIGCDWRRSLQIDENDEAQRATSIFAEDPENPLSFETRIRRPDGSEVWVIGQMLPQFDPEGELTGHVGVITDISARKAAELELIESERRLRELSTHMVQIEERHRAMVAREIHDDIGSSLTGIKIDLAWLKRELAGELAGRPDAQAKLADLEKLVDSTAAVSRRLIKALRPSILDHGIVPAIQWQLLEFERRFGVRGHFDAPKDEPNLTEEQAIAVFRVVQEALTNVAKHAAATKVEITLFQQARELTVEIRDNGRGLKGGQAERPGSYGVIGMRERMHSLGGWLEISGAAGQGVTLMLGIPYQGEKHLRRA